MIRYICIFIILLSSSCSKDEDNVVFEINLIDTYPLEIVEFQENIYVKLYYQHPEGYLGFSDPDYLSLEVKDSRLSEADYYHVIPLTPPNNSLSVTGEILVEIDSPFVFGNGLMELVNFSIRIQDQNLVWSNEIQTPNISVIKE
ncbi:MAG: hypothetical protein ACKVH2_01525 [Flavobacteriales bacterium]|jgi:hypothetical protein|tara:strand:+ start:2742 stop:3173 length:432 start_codon:yes stop_codon:yes gene_type:complete